MNQRTQPPLPADLAAKVVGVIRDAYRENAPLQDPSLGHGNWTYALTNVETIKHFLRERVGGDVVVIDGHSLRLEVEGRVFYIHKLGRSERDDPWTSLPGHPGPAGRATEMFQLRLDFGPIDTPDPRIWVIGHYGTLEDGVRAIRLQASGAADAGRIRSWLEVVDIWVVPHAETTMATASVPPAPRPVDVDEVPLTPKRQLAAEVPAHGKQ